MPQRGNPSMRRYIINGVAFPHDILPKGIRIKGLWEGAGKTNDGNGSFTFHYHFRWLEQECACS
jgi:hypothetical protein